MQLSCTGHWTETHMPGLHYPTYRPPAACWMVKQCYSTHIDTHTHLYTSAKLMVLLSDFCNCCFVDQMVEGKEVTPCSEGYRFKSTSQQGIAEIPLSKVAAPRVLFITAHCSYTRWVKCRSQISLRHRGLCLLWSTWQINHILMLLRRIK